MRYTLILLLAALQFVSCNNPTSAEIRHQSPNGKVNLTITGKRSTGLESWKVVISVSAYSFKKGQLAFEIYAPDLNEENVTFEWQDDQHCLIRFREQDDHVRTFRLTASPESMTLLEIE